MVRASIILFALATAMTSARADDARALATEYKDAGAAAMEEGRFHVALQQFRAAYQAYPSANLLFNIGLALAALHRDDEAAEAFEDFLARADQTPAAARQHARDQLKELSSRLGRLLIKCNRSGAPITVDAREVGAAPLSRPVYVLAGAHDVTIRNEQVHAQVTVTAGQMQEVELSAPLASPSRRLARLGGAWGMGGLALASLVVGTTLFLVAEPEFERLSTACVNRQCTESDVRRVRALYDGSYALWGIAAGAAVVDIVCGRWSRAPRINAPRCYRLQAARWCDFEPLVCAALSVLRLPRC